MKPLQMRRINYMLKRSSLLLFLYTTLAKFHCWMSRCIWQTISYFSFMIVFFMPVLSTVLYLTLVYWNISWQYQAVIILPSFSTPTIASILDIYSDLRTEPSSSLLLPINGESVEFNKMLLLYLLVKISCIPCCFLIIVEHSYFVHLFCSLLSL